MIPPVPASLGFGVEVAQRLTRRQLLPDVEVVDFGIRGIDLTYALLDGCRAAVLVDAHAARRRARYGHHHRA